MGGRTGRQDRTPPVVLQQAVIGGRPLRPGDIWLALAKIMYSHGDKEGGYVTIIERGGGSARLREIPLSRITVLKKGYIILDDGTLIPLHRIMSIVDGKGRTLYSRLEPKKRASSQNSV